MTPQRLFTKEPIIITYQIELQIKKDEGMEEYDKLLRLFIEYFPNMWSYDIKVRFEER